MPVVILEGIDGAGKSTLAKKIADLIPRHFDTVLTHRGVPKHGPELEYMHQLEWLRNNHFMVADRYHVGDLIYGPIYRNESLTKDYWFAAIEDKLNQLNATKIILLPPLDVVRQRLEARGEDYLQPEHVHKVWHFYNDFADANPTWAKITETNHETAQLIINSTLEGR